MKYRAVIFDLDGTLLDTIDDLLDNLEHAFKSLNMRGGFSRQEMESFLGSGKKAQVERALLARGYGLDRYDELNQALSIRYELNAENKTKPFEGIVSLLASLKQKGVAAFCLTNKPHDVAVKVTKAYFPSLLVATYGIRPNSPVKPDPVLVDNMLKAHGLNRENTLYVGDSDVDMMTANQGGLDSVFVTWGYVRQEQVEQYRPKYIVSSPADIMNIIEG